MRRISTENANGIMRQFKRQNQRLNPTTGTVFLMTTKQTGANAADLKILAELEKKVLWLSSWTIHHANHLRRAWTG